AAGRARRLDQVLARVVDIADHHRPAGLLDLADGVDRVELRGREIDEQHVRLAGRDMLGHIGATRQPLDGLAARRRVHLRREHQVMDGGQHLHAHTPAPGFDPYGSPSTRAMRPSASFTSEPGTISSLCTYPSSSPRAPTCAEEVTLPFPPSPSRIRSAGASPSTSSRTRFQATRPRKVAIATTS